MPFCDHVLSLLVCVSFPLYPPPSSCASSSVCISPPCLQNLYATAMLHDAIWMYAAAAELAIAAGDSVQNAMDYTPSVNFTGMLFTINQVFNSVYTECNLAHPAHSCYLPDYSHLQQG